jgi:DNA-binding IclR family transcriptional regulator
LTYLAERRTIRIAELSSPLWNAVGPVPVKAVGKALALLDHIVMADIQDDALPLSELAARIGAPPNTVHNLLKSMTVCGYVARTERGRYAPGPKLRQLGRANRLLAPAAVEAILAEMHVFSRAEAETCLLATLLVSRRVVIASVDGTQAVRVSHATLEDSPFFSKATGRMLAALAGPSELDAILERHGFPGANWDGISDVDALRTALAHLRADAGCVVRERDTGVVALACPVLDSSGAPWGAAGAFAPAYRCPNERCDQLLTALRDLATRLTPHLT